MVSGLSSTDGIECKRKEKENVYRKRKKYVDIY